MNPKLQLMIQHTIQAFQSGNFDLAISTLSKNLQRNISSAETIFDLGITYAEGNKLEEALIIFDCLRLYKGSDARIPFNIGIIHSLRGKYRLAIEQYNQALKIQPDYVVALINIGAIYNELKNYALALEALDKAIELNKNYHEAYSNKGNALHKLKRYDEAIIQYDMALDLKPDDHEALANKGASLHELERYDEAIIQYDMALDLKPDDHEALANKGASLHKLKRYDDAIAHCDKVLSINPADHEAWRKKGVSLNALKRYDDAITHFDKALSLGPDDHEAWSNKGVTLHELKRFDEAITHFDKALSLKPDYAEGWSNKGVTLHELKRFDEAITHFDKALSLKPDYAEGWSNKGVTLHELKRFDEAITHYDKVLSLKPKYHNASLNKSLSLLLLGDLEHGLPLYESRWDSDKVSEITGKRFLDAPTWLGAESLQGKTILLYAEQGFGDFIQFCRYVKLVSELDAKVILEIPKALSSLLENLEGVSQLVIKGQELPFFDYQCSLLSLPLAFNTNIYSIPARIPYLSSSAEQVARWRLKLGEKRNKRVGLVWSSMSDFKEDSKRSLLLSDFVRALPLEGFEYICLQKELKECDREFFREFKKIKFFGNELENFSDTAALIENLDLVISTCTSVPHLSAALGKETWVLLSHVPDWRWFLDRKDSPWYPSIRLYRQAALGDWVNLLDKVKSDLSGVFS